MNPRTCVQRGAPEHRRSEALSAALLHRRSNVGFLPVDAASPSRLRAVVQMDRLWEPGHSLTVGFLEGDTALRARVATTVQQWSDAANIHFEFVSGDASDADIRIAFIPKQAWSYVGTDALTVPRDEPTMSLGPLTPQSSDSTCARYVLHEFGHALGMLHEHQSPAAGVPWDEPAVYEYYRATYGWDTAMVDANVLSVADHTNFTEFDRWSIMLYPVPEELTRGQFTTSWNDSLSEQDREFMALCYPAAPRDLRTLAVAGPRQPGHISSDSQVDVFTMTVAESVRHIIDTRGPTDVHLTLFRRGDDEPVGSDDDRGLGANARLVRRLSPGEYEVHVRGQRGARGEYDIGARTYATSRAQTGTEHQPSLGTDAGGTMPDDDVTGHDPVGTQTHGSTESSDRPSLTQLQEQLRRIGDLLAEVGAELDTRAAAAVVQPDPPAGSTSAPARLPVPAAAPGDVASASDTTDELEKGGPALGAFVKAVGLAVAASQTELDKNLVATAEALSKQRIKVISVFEQVIDDDGRMKSGSTIESELPLINYLMPTAYAWSRVYLDADMNVKEFNARNGLNIQASRLGVYASANASYGMFSGFSGGASAGFGYSSSNTAVQTSTSTDEASGHLHLEATLEPRADVQLPRPFIIQKGPRITLSLGSITDVSGTPPAGGGPALPTGRQVSVTALVQREDGSPNAAKPLSVRVEPPGLDVTGSMVTDANGKISLTIVRKGAMYDNNAPQVDATVRVSLGLVSEFVSVRF